MLSDLPKLTESGNGRAGGQAALKEQVSGVATWVCQNLKTKHQEKPFLLVMGLPGQPKNKTKENKSQSIPPRWKGSQSAFSKERKRGQSLNSFNRAHASLYAAQPMSEFNRVLDLFHSLRLKHLLTINSFTLWWSGPLASPTSKFSQRRSSL